ncbi:FecR domain-containing protein [Tunicatimonas pelagia]|uniref:FecR domain-containing protein n=1 Tax=Tunicatimonas pelagia TaxID=931531 RepID=UPI002665C6BA|nr:FecR domain-containing protein [Tunicatimonas pelagia]WKN42108.1 DUF4974 domain-containing protein [Tunicatimonas pelagia]
MQKNIDEALFRKFWRGECTSEEQQRVEAWLTNPEHQSLVDRWLKQEWDTPTSPPPSRLPDTEQALRRLQQSISPPTEAPTLPLHRRTVPYWLRIAATLVLPIIALAVYYFIYQTTEVTSATLAPHVSYENPSGQRSKIRLPDGSTVWLQAASALQFPPGLRGPLREVSLVGEAFFEVTENPDRPFVVHTPDMDVRVLGTSFNVSAFPDDSVTETTLVSGSVALRQPNDSIDQLIIEPNQQAYYHHASGAFSSQTVDPSFATAWKEGYLKFQNHSFAEVATELERWYGVTIQYDAQKLSDQPITFTLSDESLEQVLHHLTTLLPIHYTIDRQHIIID